MNISKLILNKPTIPQQKATSFRNFQPLMLVVLLVFVLAAWGTVLAAQSLAAPTPLLSEVYSINQPADTSFGTIIVSQADDLIGLTSQDLAGVTHGIQNLVLVDSAQIQITVALINRTGRPVPIAPEQFRLTTPDSSDAILISGATFRSGELRPRSNMDATLSFVVPRDGANYILQYLDPGSDQTVQIDLVGVDVVSEEELNKLHH